MDETNKKLDTLHKTLIIKKEDISDIEVMGLKGDTGEQGVQGEKGEKGDKGDRGEKGATTIVEKVIEKTEVIHEVPIVTNEVKEVAIHETPKEIKDKLASLIGEDRLDKSSVKGLDKVIDQPALDRAVSILDQRTSFLINKINNLPQSTGGSGTPGGSANSIQYNNAGAFGGFGSFNGTNALNLSGISITSAGLTTTGIFQQSGDQATFDVAGSSFAVKTTLYPGYGLINADNTGIVSIGDFFGDVNNTYIFLDDASETVGYKADNGHMFTGDMSMSSTAYPDGLFKIEGIGNFKLGDVAGDVNQTNINGDDGSKIINYRADNGHTFTGQVKTGAGTSTADGLANVPLTVTGTINGYNGIQVQNLSSGISASSDYLVANDIDDGTIATGHYADFGYNSSAFSDGAVFPAFSLPNDMYLYTVGGRMVMGTATAGKSFDIFTGGLDLSNRRMRITGTGNIGFGTVAPNNFFSVAPPRYSTGTASQSTNIITGVGTTWTSAMIGNLFEFDDGTSAGTITARASNTSITVSTSQTVASQTYSIHYSGIEVSSVGKVGINTTDPQAVLEITNNLLGASTANNNGVVVANNTSAALGAQQISPPIRLRGNGWATTSSTSMPVDWVIEHLPVQGAAAPSGFFNLKVSINGGAYTTPFSVSSAGAINFLGQISATSGTFTQTIVSATTAANANFEVFATSAGITTAQALNGSTNTQSRTRLGGSGNTVLTANNSHANLFIQGTSITEATSGTHPLLASLAVRPLAITNGTATTTAAATVYIEGAATGTTPAANYALMVGAGDSYFGGKIIANDVVRTKGYTVATLPAGTLGDTAHVTNALAPAMGVAVAGGGAANAKVWYNGAAWTVTGI